MTEPYTPVPTVISWPVTFLVGTLDETNYSAIDQNPFEVEVSNQSIVEAATQTPLLTHVLHPGDDPFSIWPDGNRQRWMVGLYAPAPFKPNTKYEVHADVSTVDGDFRVSYNFTTAAGDPGLELMPPPIEDPGLTARLVPGGHSLLAANPDGRPTPAGFVVTSKSSPPPSGP